MNKVLCIVLFAIANYANAGQIFSSFPSEINADEAYVIYSHGLIVEGDDPRPVHSKFGAYEFDLIKHALADGSDFNVIAEQRPKNTEIAAYVRKLSAWVERLISAGVSPASITLVGFSRGGELTARASSVKRDLGINTILLATCWRGSVQSDPSVIFAGNFLSVYETTDGARSCKEIADRSEKLTSFTEVAITTNLEHGAFFKPLDEWILPVKNWIKEKQLLDN